MKKLLVIGASEKQVPIIKRAKELGNKVLCLDGNKDSIGFEYADEYDVIDVTDIKKCLEYAKNNKIDGVTTLSATVTLPAVNYIAQEMNLVGNNYEISETLKSKYEMKKVLFKNNLNISGNFFQIHNLEQLKDMVDKIELPVVIKPSDGSASKGVSIVHKKEELENLAKYALENSRNSSAYIEGYIKGEEYGVESFAYKGEVSVLGIIKQTMKLGEDNLLDYGHCVPSGLSKEIEELIKDQAIKAIKALNIENGSVNMDIILSEQGVPYIIDIGPRIGLNLIASHIIPYSTGVNIIDNTIKLALNEQVSLDFKQNTPIATRLIITKPGIIKEIAPYEHLMKNSNILEIILKVKKGDLVKPYKVKSDTCGWIIARGNTVEEANENAYRAKKEIDKLFMFE